MNGLPVARTEAGELSISGKELSELMRDALARGATFRFRARGWSMAPFIRDGDTLTVSPPAPREPSVGQVVAFVRPGTGQLLVHRVIAAAPRGYDIQGDNAPGTLDVSVPLEEILGWVTRVTRDGRDVRLGLGPERRLIALLSRAGWLQPLWDRLATVRSLFMARPGRE
jgi:hypothetical protein